MNGILLSFPTFREKWEMGRRLVCGVDGSENKRAFSSVVLTKKSSDYLEAMMTFESEIRQGEHAKAKNLAAILTKRLNKALP